MSVDRRETDNALDPALIARFAALVGPAGAITDPEAMAPHLVEWRDRYRGRTPLVLKPGTVEEVSAILRLAQETRTPIVPQGGNTGLVGGQIPHETGGEIVLSLTRLDRIRSVDGETGTMIAEAGVTLAGVQEAAEAAGRLFPLSLASEGTCQIGGNIATNAGGIAALAHGTARNLVLGLEVVLADGRIWDGLRLLKKDNTGYDLKQLFIGSEGTLGVITAAALRLAPRPAERATAFAGLASVRDVARLFSMAEREIGHALTSFEIMGRICLDFVLRHGADTRDPLAEPHAWYVLLEISGLKADGRARSLAEDLLTRAMEEGLVRDGVLAGSLAQAQALWRLRELVSEVQKPEGGSIKCDVSVPVSRIPEFIARAGEAVARLLPGARPVPFGHFGDGNIHYNISQPEGGDREAFLERWEEIAGAVHEIVLDLGGSISAEHGIGRMKRHLMPAIKSPVELDLMRRIKAALDAEGILNPGKLL